MPIILHEVLWHVSIERKTKTCSKKNPPPNNKVVFFYLKKKPLWDTNSRPFYGPILNFLLQFHFLCLVRAGSLKVIWVSASSCMEPSVCSGWRTCPRTQLLFWASACCSAPKWSDCHLACFMPHLVIYLAALPYALDNRLWTLESSRVFSNEAKHLCTAVAGNESWLHCYGSTGENRRGWKESKSTWKYICC